MEKLFLGQGWQDEDPGVGLNQPGRQGKHWDV